VINCDYFGASNKLPGAISPTCEEVIHAMREMAAAAIEIIHTSIKMVPAPGGGLEYSLNYDVLLPGG
jgi:hypothetical protein